MLVTSFISLIALKVEIMFEITVGSQGMSNLSFAAT